jgi:hypothetical protein
MVKGARGCARRPPDVPEQALRLLSRPIRRIEHMRDQLLSSGVPVMIAGVCFIGLAYLARVRRERFLVYWTAGWALLVVRLGWTIAWGSPWPALWPSITAAYLRLAMAGCLLAGTEELRGRRVDARLVFGAAALFLVAKQFIDPFISIRAGIALNLGAMAVTMLIASWRLATYTPLPRAERALAALGLAGYSLLSATMPMLRDDNPLLRVLFFSAWTTQLCAGVGMLALFFRLSYETELAVEKTRGATLTEALQGFIPICMHCKAIRNEEQHWKALEQYVADRSSVRFSHGLCPTCARTHYGAYMGRT